MVNHRYITAKSAAFSILYQGLGDLETAGHPKHYLITKIATTFKTISKPLLINMLTKKRLKYLASLDK